MPTQYHFAFWNRENLFNIENSPLRTDKVARDLGKSIKRWTRALLDHKISQWALMI